MDWSQFFTIIAQVLIGLVVLVVAGATIIGIRKEWKK